jgi:hypothetical protein
VNVAAAIDEWVDFTETLTYDVLVAVPES